MTVREKFLSWLLFLFCLCRTDLFLQIEEIYMFGKDTAEFLAWWPTSPGQWGQRVRIKGFRGLRGVRGVVVPHPSA